MMTKEIHGQKIRPLEDFPFQAHDKLRYGDTDRQGHVNNASFATFLETGRAEFLYDPDHPRMAPGTSFVIAGLKLNFLSEINWPGVVLIGTGITRVGNSSLHLAQGVFQEGRCAATAESVIVQVHDQTGKSHPLSDEAKAFFARNLLES